MNSIRFLRQIEWDADVVDVDTYGEPWGHYAEIGKRILDHAITVFLTVGIGSKGWTGMSKGMLGMLGIPATWMDIAGVGAGMGTARLISYAFAFLPFSVERYDVLEGAYYPTPGGGTIYLGLRLCPRATARNAMRK